MNVLDASLAMAAAAAVNPVLCFVGAIAFFGLAIIHGSKTGIALLGVGGLVSFYLWSRAR